MELTMTVTLVIIGAMLALFIFATLQARKPAEPLKVRYINYHVIQMACIVVILVMAAHVLTLAMGRPVTAAGRPY